MYAIRSLGLDQTCFHPTRAAIVGDFRVAGMPAISQKGTPSFPDDRNRIVGLVYNSAIGANIIVRYQFLA